MANKKKSYDYKDLITAYNYVNQLLDIDIASKNRAQLYVDGRTLYYMLANNTTNASYSEIALIVGRDHSTVTHANQNLVDALRKNRKYLGYYDTYMKNFFVAPDNSGDIRQFVTDQEELVRLRIVEEAFLELKLNTTHVEALTENEVAYRALDKDSRAQYDNRALLVLKSFAWKTRELSRKEEFEIINVGM
tara:strand:- start:256 stop:828 length:573 start_codon:yes stop_codon:yes gene_type:complete